jgi:hypothetical protein
MYIEPIIPFWLNMEWIQKYWRNGPLRPMKVSYLVLIMYSTWLTSCRLCLLEIKTSRVKMWVQFFFTWARRRAGDGLPAPPLPAVPRSREAENERPSTPTATDPNRPRYVTGNWRPPPEHRYPAFEVYKTMEEARFEQRRRQIQVGQLPPSALRRAWEQMQTQAGDST